MKKFAERGLSVFMAAVMCCNMALCAFAADPPVTETVRVETQAGSSETVTVEKTETEIAGEGGTVATVDKKADDFVTANGMTVDYTMHSDMATDRQGVTTGTASEDYTSQSSNGLYTATGGSRTKIEKVTPQVEVEIPLTAESGKNTAKSTTETSGKTVVTGKEETDDTDGVYDYTTTVSSAGGFITVTTATAQASQKILPADDKKMEYVFSSLTPADGNKIMKNCTIPAVPENVTISEGYDHIFIGSAMASEYWPALLFKTPDSNGIVYTDEAGQNYYAGAARSVFEGRSLTLSHIYANGRLVEGENGLKSFPAQYDSAQHFVLADRYGNRTTTYCADQQTGTQDDYLYKMENVEDATYYSPENAKKIRGVALNGYWGNDGDPGSLSSFKQKLKATGLFTDDEISRITDGMALSATQISIWTFSNHMDETMFVGVYDSPNHEGLKKQKTDEDGNYLSNGASLEDTQLIFKIVNYLTTTNFADKEENNTGNTIINAANFLNSASANIKGKNGDEYLTDILFSLKVKPRSQKDSLLVTITDENGNILAKGRVSGEVGEGEIDLSQHYSNGEYFFPDIPLAAGQTKTIKFHMTGWQDLDQGAYLYTSEVKNGIPSQTLVGIASGPRDVDVEMNLQFQFDVYDEIIKTHRVFREEKILDPQPVKDTLGGIKLLDDQPAAGFTFVLKDGEGKEIQKAVSDENGSFEFEPVEFADEGEYTFTISEEKGDDASVIWDQSVFEVQYTVVKENYELAIAEKTVVQSGDMSADSEDNQIMFANSTYLAAYGTVDGTKIFEGRTPAGYSFVLESSDGTYSQTVSSAADGSFEFEPVEFNAPDVYSYTVKEAAGADRTVLYDDKVYQVVFTVTANDRQLEVNREIMLLDESGQGTKAEKIEFMNEIRPTPTPTPTPAPAATPTPPPPDVPQTGDASIAWLNMFALAFAMLVAVLVVKRRINR